MFKFFLIIFYINLFTIGGGYVMIPLLQKKIVEKAGLLSYQEFIETIAIGQVTPGPLTIMNAFIRYKLFGLTGAIGAAVSTYLPSLIVVTFISYYYHRFRDSGFVSSIMKGIKPAIVGILLAAFVSFGKVSIVDIQSLLIATISFFLLISTKIDLIFVILGAGIAAFILVICLL